MIATGIALLASLVPNGLAAASIGITITIQLEATMATPKTFSLARASVIAPGIALLASRVSNGLAAALIGITVTITIHGQRSNLLVATMPTPKTFSLARASAIATGSALLAFHVSYGQAAKPFLGALVMAAASIGITVTFHWQRSTLLVAAMPAPKTFSLARASASATDSTLLASRVSNGQAA